jgi:hypothetical protein
LKKQGSCDRQDFIIIPLNAGVLRSPDSCPPHDPSRTSATAEFSLAIRSYTEFSRLVECVGRADACGCFSGRGRSPLCEFFGIVPSDAFEQLEACRRATTSRESNRNARIRKVLGTTSCITAALGQRTIIRCRCWNVAPKLRCMCTGCTRNRGAQGPAWDDRARLLPERWRPVAPSLRSPDDRAEAAATHVVGRMSRRCETRHIDRYSCLTSSLPRTDWQKHSCPLFGLTQC